MTSDATKRKVFEALLCTGSEVMVHVLPTPETKLPTGELCVIVYGLNQPNPIPDLVVLDTGISATLSFLRTPTPTFVPWAAVQVMVLKAPLCIVQWPPTQHQQSLDL
jgi:hypothetical protein